MLDNNTIQQLKQYLTMLEGPVVFRASLGTDENSDKMREFLLEVTALSHLLTLEEVTGTRKPQFAVDRPDYASGIIFAGLPLGHEFASFILAVLQVSGRVPKISEEDYKQIEAINDPLHFETFISLTCQNCPDVVQALNIMAVLNPNIRHTMIEGGTFKEEVEAKNILAVPTVFLNGVEFSSGRGTLTQLLKKIPTNEKKEFKNRDPFDILVVGGGPAGASAAIYAARKGIKTGLLANEFGGQVLETLSIENIIGTPKTQGTKFMAEVKQHVEEYDVDLISGEVATSIQKDDLVTVNLENGANIQSKAVILATGAHWKNLGIPGEDEFKNKGVAYCPHCDGPLFAGKDVAVIGGGNSGIEAAIDLAGICRHVYVLEFLPELKADKILQERLAGIENVTVILNAETTSITGTDRVESLTYRKRETGEKESISVAGTFILIGLQPNTKWLENTPIALNNRKEVITAADGATNVAGIFAAGDCTDSRYKQIIIAMGSGATAALGAFDYLIRQG
ncbi:putative NADH oxidase/alkyl hydroperoxidase reductase [Enterococcus saigonensis]|uniref:Putative NADH oxidase/alkyl hydroperoxidase reductase n=1 Tax=Enterococcus saigonensis TaxID=1805431 RepID=A0A679IR19_9ENTE|nr:alkyl hydroperoxide reductase subunit F [Enterococcus saigonensis]BCA85687.1 putative NADH oxidase/alkyl hydroperoxidase reductase [Enterococcus saigonensis]